MPVYRWSPSADTISYVLERSIDHGLTWANITTITHDYGGADYDSATQTFFYTDVAPALGEMVRVYGANAEGAGEAFYLFGQETTTATCNIYGVLQHQATAQPLRGAEVIITPSDQPYSTLRPGTSTPAVSQFAQLGGKREFRVFSDDEGKWNIDLVRGITVKVRIPDAGFDQSFKVPEDRDVLNITDAYIYRSDARFSGGQSNWSQGPRFTS